METNQGGAMRLQSDSALIVVDMQNDFVTGSLAVPGAEKIAATIWELAIKFRNAGAPRLYTRCYHPSDHCSFKGQGGPWPPHCVAGTYGAELYAPLRNDGSEVLKGIGSNKDAYSAFDGTGLDDILKLLRIRYLYVCGVATDYCVRSTVLDAIQLGYLVYVLLDAVAAVNVNEGDGKRAIGDMLLNGAVLTSTASLQ